MRVPQVSERIKEAPAQALRGVFAGIGQLLLITDKIRNKTSADEDTLRARTPKTAATVTHTIVTSPADKRENTVAAPSAEPAPAAAEAVTAKPSAVKPASTRDLDKTGNVRLLNDANGSPAREATAPAGTPPAAAVSADTGPADTGPADTGPADTGPADTGPADTGPADTGPAGTGAPPLPNYDELSLASLRARLRNLDAAQVRQLADYERRHAARADVLGMFERRIAKLEAEG